MPVREFSASYDSTTKAITAVVCLLLIVVAWMVHIIFIALLFPLLIGLAYAYSPRGYAIAGVAIMVKRPIGNVRVPLADIREVRAGTPDDFTGVIRLFGNGGLFGFYGLFRTAKLGKCNWYVTDRSKTVIVVASHRTLVLSPDDVQGFISAAGAPATRAAGSGPQSQTGNAIGKIVAISVAAIVLAMVAMTVAYAPGPPSYTLTRDTLTIHDRFYPVTLHADATDAAGVRIVDLRQDLEWRPTLRTNGFANRNYQSGWFRVTSGASVRMYRAGGQRLVLIPPKGSGTAVLYQAMDPDRFAQELRREWTP
jgi:hypothetical protein